MNIWTSIFGDPAAQIGALQTQFDAAKADLYAARKAGDAASEKAALERMSVISDEMRGTAQYATETVAAIQDVAAQGKSFGSWVYLVALYAAAAAAVYVTLRK